MTANILDGLESFYFVGIGGVSMSALAKLLKIFGKKVGGTDRCRSEYTDELISLGVAVEIGDGGNVSEYDAVVFTDAIAENNKTLAQARSLNKIIISRGELLFLVSKKFKRVIAVSGCHGKTTCCSMLAHVFTNSGKAVGWHIGGSDVLLNNAGYKGNDYFITEACEYKRNLLKLQPDFAVVLNCDADHLDCYSTAADLKSTYSVFADKAQCCISLYGELEKKAVTFGFDDRADYYAKHIKSVCGKYSFKVYEGGAALGEIKLNVYGKHNVLNALAAVAVARRLGLSFVEISKGLSEFIGVKRRFEGIGKFNGVKCIADYAHHPNEIKATLKSARLITSGNIYVVFQPHTYSRTKTLFRQFVEVLSTQKKLMIYKTYAAREYYDDGGSALTLSQSIKHSVYGDDEHCIKKFLSDVKVGDLILFLGAGDIYEIAKSIIN